MADDDTEPPPPPPPRQPEWVPDQVWDRPYQQRNNALYDSQPPFVPPPPPTVESSWEVVLAQRALMEATMRAIPSAARHIGPDHNGGPELVPNATQDLIETNHFIDLLKDDRPRGKREIEALVERAKAAIETAEKGRTALNVFALGIIAGAGHVVGSKTIEALMETPWWTAFYTRLAELASAVLAWAHLAV